MRDNSASLVSRHLGSEIYVPSRSLCSRVRVMVVGERVQISPRKALRQAITTGRETIVRTEALGGCEATTTFAEKVCGRTATRQLEASKRRDPGAQFPFREWQDEVNSAHMGVHNFSVTQQSPPQQPQDANAEKQRERERGRRSSKPSSLPQPEPLRERPEHWRRIHESRQKPHQTRPDAFPLCNPSQFERFHHSRYRQTRPSANASAAHWPETQRNG
mmetsp:Transcript_11429/g.31636  ORF Transcript_11429/g.31636 Transcript_11429/m.31636 type:complete len:218 (-) Transcript_11429:1226-1879(-)